MKVNPFFSIAAKLFYLTSGVVLLTVAINSWQNGKTFKQLLNTRLQDSTILRAKAASQNVENTINNWASQVNLMMHDLHGSTRNKYKSKLNAFVKSNKEYLAIHVFNVVGNKPSLVASSFSSKNPGSRFEGVSEKKVFKKLVRLPKKWLNAYLPTAGSRELVLESFADQLKVPVMAMALKYSNQKSKTDLWVVLTAWQTHINAALPKSDVIRSYVIDKTGHVFSAPNIEETVARKDLKGNALARTALTGSTQSGFKGRYTDDTKEEWLGAFVNIPKYEISIIVEHKAKVAYAAISRIIRKAALWGLLLVLFAVLFSFIGASGLTKNLRAVIHATRQIAMGDFQTRVEPRSHDELAVLSHSVNQMAQQIVDLLAMQVEQARVEKELETARMVQSTFFPKENISTSNLSITGYYQPATECGGDWWGHFSSNQDDGIEYLFIADAMGHGVPAALVTAMAYSSCMTLSNIIQDRTMHHDSPSAILERFNRVLYDAVRGTISMTFFVAIFDTRNQTLSFANAGHNFPILIPESESDDRASKKRLKSQTKISQRPPISLKLRGTPLGMVRDSTYEEKTIPLRENDKIFFFTDGLIECSSPSGEMWGRKVLVEKILQNIDENILTLKNNVIKSAFEHFAEKPLDDDITVVVVEASKNLSTNSEPLPEQLKIGA